MKQRLLPDCGLCSYCQLLQTSQTAAEQVTVNISAFIKFGKGLSCFAFVAVDLPAAYAAAVLTCVFDEPFYVI